MNLMKEFITQLLETSTKLKLNIVLLNVRLAEGERTELVMKIRTEDGMTNGAGNVIKLVQLLQESKPSGIVWIQFDHSDVVS